MKFRKAAFWAPTLPSCRSNGFPTTDREDRTMQCGKCKGLMVREQFSDYFLIVYAWKCINCGAIVDATITHNQKKRPAEAPRETVSQ